MATIGEVAEMKWPVATSVFALGFSSGSTKVF